MARHDGRKQHPFFTWSSPCRLKRPRPTGASLQVVRLRWSRSASRTDLGLGSARPHRCRSRPGPGRLRPSLGSAHPNRCRSRPGPGRLHPSLGSARPNRCRSRPGSQRHPRRGPAFGIAFEVGSRLEWPAPPVSGEWTSVPCSPVRGSGRLPSRCVDVSPLARGRFLFLSHRSARLGALALFAARSQTRRAVR